MPDTEIKKAEEKLIHWRMVIQSWVHSRKALIFLVAFVIAGVALFVGRLNGDQWVTFVKWLIPAYLAANVADGAVVTLAKKSETDS